MDVVYKPPFTPVGTNVQPAHPAAPDLLSYLALYGTRIHQSVYFNTDNNVHDIYQVPEGKLFFLVEAHISVLVLSAAQPLNAVSAEIILFTNPSTSYSNVVSAFCQDHNAANGSVSFPIPLRVLAGQKFQQDAPPWLATSGYGVATIAGYEIDISLLNSIM